LRTCLIPSWWSIRLGYDHTSQARGLINKQQPTQRRTPRRPLASANRTTPVVPKTTEVNEKADS
jgi:hypothetical protein